jgi:uncharacterized protein YndB with AHSA1/START domain
MLLKHTHKSLLKKPEDVKGLENMTLSEKLKHSDLTYDFDKAMLNNQTRAIQILQYLKVDEDEIKAIISTYITKNFSQTEAVVLQKNEDMSDQSIVISKRFPVSPDLVYKAWTEESALKEWWKPMGKTLVSVENNIEEGGKIEYLFEDDDNPSGKLTIHGTYQTAIPESKLVYSWNWELDSIAVENANYTLTVEFSEQGEETELKIEQKREKELEGVQPHKEGWDEALESLGQYLDKG